MRCSIAVASLLWLCACVSENKLVDRFVEDYCEARWSCGCDSPGLTQVHCESTLPVEGEEAQAAAQEAGLEYDRTCARAWLDAIDDSCAVQPVPRDTSFDDERRCGDPCPPYHGSKGKGEPCREIGPWSDCGRGLRCGVLDVCEDPCDGVREGDVCDHGDYTSDCTSGLVCGVDGTCGRPPALGEACRQECAPGAMCDYQQNLCVEAPGFGEPCGFSDACGRNLRCVQGVCDVGRATVCALDEPW